MTSTLNDNSPCILCDVGCVFSQHHLLRHRMAPHKAELFRQELMTEPIEDINMIHVDDVDDTDASFFTFDVSTVFDPLEPLEPSPSQLTRLDGLQDLPLPFNYESDDSYSGIDSDVDFIDVDEVIEDYFDAQDVDMSESD